MKKRIPIFCTCLFFVFSAYAQVDERRDTINIGPEKNILENNIDIQNRDDRQHISAEDSYRELSPQEIERRKDFLKIMEFETPQFYPPTQEKSFGRVLPDNNDYAFYNFMPLGKNAVIATSSTRETYPVGMINQIDANLMYAVNDWLTVSGGIYTAKYGMLDYQSDFGFNASMRFKLHDRLYLNLHGRYSAGMYDRHRYLGQQMEGLFPQTSYGGGLEFKITDKVGIGGGIIREFNPFNRKWTNRPYVFPVFYK